MSLRCSVYIAVSLDGFIARADGGIDWLSVVEREGQDYGYARFFGSVDTVVLGRKTYDTALQFPAWSYEGKRTIVLTHGSTSSRHGEEFYEGDLAELRERLLREGSKHVYVDGGTVISQALALGIIDEITVSVIPILLGDGIRLTQGIGRDVRLRLLEQASFESGLVQLRYAASEK